MLSNYSEERKDFAYYKRVVELCKTLAPSAESVISIGSSDTDYHLILKKLAPIVEKAVLDLRRVPQEEDANLVKIKADFYQYSPTRKYDLAICLQTIEHVSDPKTFIQKIFSISDKVIISLPYMWPEGTVGHLHNFIDEKKIFSWASKKPTYSEIVRDGARRRILMIYDSKKTGWLSWKIAQGFRKLRYGLFEAIYYFSMVTK